MTDQQDTASRTTAVHARQTWDAPTLSVMAAEDAELQPSNIRPEGLAFGS